MKQASAAVRSQIETVTDEGMQLDKKKKSSFLIQTSNVSIIYKKVNKCCLKCSES